MIGLQSLQIHQYRGIKELSVSSLGRLNIILGDNNCGKTSFLESIQILSSSSFANACWVGRQRNAFGLVPLSAYDSFITMFPMGKYREIDIEGTFLNQTLSFQLAGELVPFLYDPSEEPFSRVHRSSNIPYTENREEEREQIVEAFDGVIRYSSSSGVTEEPAHFHEMSRLSSMRIKRNEQFEVTYLSPCDYLRQAVLFSLLENEDYKNNCINILQLFDLDIQDLLILRSRSGNRPVDYIKHAKLGTMPLTTFGDGLKRVLSLANAVCSSTDGILLIDEIETSLHKQYYHDVFSFLMEASKEFNVQLFVTTHSIEAVDALLQVQNYCSQEKADEVRVITLKQNKEKTLSRVLKGQEVAADREAFDFEVRL